LPFFEAFDAAFFFPLAPAFTLGTADDATVSSFLRASFPFSWMKISYNLTV